MIRLRSPATAMVPKRDSTCQRIRGRFRFTSRTRSTLAVFLADVALVLVTGLVPSGGAGVLERVLALFPINFSNFSAPFSALESYPLGPVVLDLIGMVLLVYGVLALVSTPVAAVSFRRHRVA